MPGSFYAQARENYQEGLRIPPVKIIKEGEVDEEIMNMILANVRLPSNMRSDLLSQVSANLTARRRLIELVERYGLETVERCMAIEMDNSERRIRSVIAGWPDGDYSAEDSMDNDGITDTPRTVRVTVRVRGDGVVVDFTGTDSQVEGPLNSVLGYTASGVYMTIQAATDPTIPPTGGATDRSRSSLPRAPSSIPASRRPARAATRSCRWSTTPSTGRWRRSPGTSPARSA